MLSFPRGTLTSPNTCVFGEFIKVPHLKCTQTDARQTVDFQNHTTFLSLCLGLISSTDKIMSYDLRDTEKRGLCTAGPPS